MTTRPRVYKSRGNVFADLGLADADLLLVKADLALRIAEVIRAHGLTQAKAAEALGIDQPKVSALLRGRLEAFSIERLLRFLVALGCAVEMRVTEPTVAKRRAGAKRPRIAVLA